MCNNAASIDDSLRDIAVAVDNVRPHTNNNSNDDDGQMTDEFLRRYSSIRDEIVKYPRNSDAADYASYADLNSNCW